MQLFEGRRHTNKTGDITEHAVMYRLLESGYGVLKPVGQMYRYDLVVEDSEGQFWRIQCKTGWLNADKTTITFAVASTYNHNTKTKGRKPYHGEVEYFGVYVEELRKVYLVPADRVGVNTA